MNELDFERSEILNPQFCTAFPQVGLSTYPTWDTDDDLNFGVDGGRLVPALPIQDYAWLEVIVINTTPGAPGTITFIAKRNGIPATDITFNTIAANLHPSDETLIKIPNLGRIEEFVFFASGGLTGAQLKSIKVVKKNSKLTRSNAVTVGRASITHPGFVYDAAQGCYVGIVPAPPSTGINGSVKFNGLVNGLEYGIVRMESDINYVASMDFAWDGRLYSSFFSPLVELYYAGDTAVDPFPRTINFLSTFQSSTVKIFLEIGTWRYADVNVFGMNALQLPVTPQEYTPMQTPTIVDLSTLSFIQDSSDAVSRTALAKMRDIYHVADFGAVGDGVTNDTLALQKAAGFVRSKGGGTLIFAPGKTYLVWAGVLERILDFRSTNGVTLIGNGCTIKSSWVNPGLFSAPAGVPLIDVSGSINTYINGFKFIGGNTVVTSATGEAFLWWGVGGLATKNLVVQNCHITKCQSGFGNAVDRAVQSANITIWDCMFDDVFYPYRSYATDNLVMRIKTTNCGRSYFPINPSSKHDVMIEASNNIIQDCLLKIYAESTFTEEQNSLSDIKLLYKSYKAAQLTAVSLDVQLAGADSLGKGNFRNIDIMFDVDGHGDSTAAMFEMSKYNLVGALDTTERGHTLRNLRIQGVVTNWASMSVLQIGHGQGGLTYWNRTGASPDIIEGVVIENLNGLSSNPVNGFIYLNGLAYASFRQSVVIRNVSSDGNLVQTNVAGKCITIENSRFLNRNSTDILSGSYVPVCASTGVAFVLGNGTIVGNYSRKGDLVRGNIRLTIGGTTTIGTGDYTFTLPVPIDPAFVVELGSALFTDAAPAQRSAGIALVSGLYAYGAFGVGSANLFGAAWPVALAVGDIIDLTFQYRATP